VELDSWLGFAGNRPWLGFVELAGQLQGDRTLNSDHRTNQESGQSVTARQGLVVPKPIHPLARGRKMPTRMPAKSIRAQEAAMGCRRALEHLLVAPGQTVSNACARLAFEK
jgi:hypothetical protein